MRFAKHQYQPWISKAAFIGSSFCLFVASSTSLYPSVALLAVTSPPRLPHAGPGVSPAKVQKLSNQRARGATIFSSVVGTYPVRGVDSRRMRVSSHQSVSLCGVCALSLPGVVGRCWPRSQREHPEDREDASSDGDEAMAP